MSMSVRRTDGIDSITPSHARAGAAVSQNVPVVASDLDRTLIYSSAALALGRRGDQDADDRVVCVEHLNGRPLSFMTAAAAAALCELGQIASFVPTTTRTREQLARVTLPGPAPRYAIAANGGFLLVDGRECPDWTGHVTAALAATAAPLDVVSQHLSSVCLPEFTRKLREADGLFCYAVIDRPLLPSGFVAGLHAWAAERGWASSLQGSKLYLVPLALSKGAAVSEVARRLGATVILAAGDSLLDAEMLCRADKGIRPGHGELAATGWANDHVATTSGVGALAGEQIAMWLLQSARTALAASQAG